MWLILSGTCAFVQLYLPSVPVCLSILERMQPKHQRVAAVKNPVMMMRRKRTKRKGLSRFATWEGKGLLKGSERRNLKSWLLACAPVGGGQMTKRQKVWGPFREVIEVRGLERTREGEGRL